MTNNNKPLKTTTVPVKDRYGIAISFCDGQSAQTLFRASASQKYIPAPYYGASRKYKKGSGSYGKPAPMFDTWDTETTIADFMNNPPCFTYVEHKVTRKGLAPNFKKDFDAIVYLLKELKLTSVGVIDNCAAHFTHTKGSFSFAVCESSNDGELTLSEVQELEILYL